MESDIYRFRLLKTEPRSPRGKEAPLHRCDPALSVPPRMPRPAAMRGITRLREPGSTETLLLTAQSKEQIITGAQG